MSSKENESPRYDRVSVDIRTHNRESLEALVAHVDDKCRQRIEEIERGAAERVARIRQAARDKAAELLREVRARERRNLGETVRTERARQQGRVRQRALAERRAMAERGLEHVREALVALWQRDEGARMTWLKRALVDARAVLGADAWELRHPRAWSPDERAETLAARIAGDATIRWQAAPAVSEGFVIAAGKAVVDATPAGLTARGARIGGVLLATLPALDSEVES